MEPTLDAVIARLQNVKEKNYESISGELLKIEDEFDKYVEILIRDNQSPSGIVNFNAELKNMHQVLVNSMISKEIEEPIVSKAETLGEELKTIEEVVEIEPEPSIVKPRASRAKVIKTEEP